VDQQLIYVVEDLLNIIKESVWDLERTPEVLKCPCYCSKTDTMKAVIKIVSAGKFTQDQEAIIK
jgi:hypothetical protein